MENQTNLHAVFKSMGLKVTKTKLAVFVAATNPDLTNEQLAKVVGYTRTSLSEPKLAALIRQARSASIRPLRVVDLDGKLLDSDTE